MTAIGECVSCGMRAQFLVTGECPSCYSATLQREQAEEDE